MNDITDVQWIFIVLAILYIIESLVWVRSGTVPFLWSLQTFRNPLDLRGLIGNESGTLQPAGWLPANALILVQPLPVAIGEHGICGVVLSSPLQRQRNPQSGITLTWAEASALKQKGHRLLYDQRTFCSVQNPRQASDLKRRLIEIANLTESERSAAIEAFRNEAFDIEWVAQRLADWQHSTKRLSIAATILMIWIFPVGLAKYIGILPIVQDWRSLIGYLAVGLVFWWWTIAEVYLAHRKLDRKSVATRWKLIFTSIVSPIVPLRVRSTLARDLLHFVHPVTFVVAAAWLRQEPRPLLHRDDAASSDQEWMLSAESIAMLRQSLRDATYPSNPLLPEGLTAMGEAIVREDHRQVLRRVERAIAVTGLDRGKLLEHRAEDERSLSYCPRCLAEFTLESTNCRECGGISTKTFAKSDTSIPA